MSTGAMVISLVVAVIAAVASVVGALSSHRSARELASLGHRIEALDAEAASFGSDYRDFLTALGNLTQEDDVGPFFIVAEMLRANRLSSDALGEAVDTAVAEARVTLSGLHSHGPQAPHETARKQRFIAEDLRKPLSNVRAEVRSKLGAVAAERTSLLEQRDRVRWWQPWRR